MGRRVIRVVLFLALLTEQDIHYPPSNEPVLNWNTALCERLVLILANGLRDDFLEQGATPYLKRISNKTGSFAKVKVEGFLGMGTALKTVMTGLPAHSPTFFWTRSLRYRTILDYHPCKCVFGSLPLEKEPDCFVMGNAEDEAFRYLEDVADVKGEQDCTYVLNFDFDGFTENEYRQRLAVLDTHVRKMTEMLALKWNQYSTVFLLTSARGWSMWNRTSGTPDVPLLIWGNGILHINSDRSLHLPDVSLLVNMLTGVSFPPGAIGHVPTYFLNVSSAVKFHILLYNLEHLKLTSGIETEELDYHRPTPEDTENMANIHQSIEMFLDTLNSLRRQQATFSALVCVVCLILMKPLYLVVVVRETISVKGWMVPVVAVSTFTTYHLISQMVLLSVLVTFLASLLFCIAASVVSAMRREGFRTYLFALTGSVVLVVFFFIGSLSTIFLLSMAVFFWPFLSRLHHRVNRRILGLWVFSFILLVFLSYFPVIGRTPIRNLVNIGVFAYVIVFLLIFRLFKRAVDSQIRITISGLISSVIQEPIMIVISSAYHSMYNPLFSWGFLIFSFWSFKDVSGTLLERLLKRFLMLLIPFHLLSTRHETFFYLGMTGLLLSWLFLENCAQRSVFSYRPSVFGIVEPAELITEGVGMKHYRQVFFFLFFCFLSYFAVGNVPFVYTYDLNVARPFGGLLPSVFVILKFLIPYYMIVQSFITLSLLQSRDPNPAFLLSLFFSDVVGACLILSSFLYFGFLDIDVSHYIIQQVITIAVTLLYMIGRTVG
ncbi:UNVERIFIED_CONTAM: hypothetical protein PYX00_004296 [Menopon gallinae]|uniref:GPI ethanolamine phosphate transferase 1 n=1 Tax=Menopon gallinae TaxID=328185 RepID=A0AAW2I5Q5_9NEOP